MRDDGVDGGDDEVALWFGGIEGEDWLDMRVDGADDAIDVVCEVGREVDAIRESVAHQGTRSECVDFVAVEACMVLVSDIWSRGKGLTIFVAVSLLQLRHDLDVFRQPPEEDVLEHLFHEHISHYRHY